MSERTGIEWTEATWNPWMGCTKVSPGCDNCYMFTEQRRYGNDPEVVRRSKTKFADPLKWKEPKLIFTCSWSDWFHKDADPWRDEAWEIIRRTPQHTYQILTKRPARIVRHLPADWGDGYPNVWLGTSVENQDCATRAWQLVRDIKAKVLFLSCEPLLGPLDLTEVWINEDTRVDLLPGIDWVIVGGESGPNAREMEIDWARYLKTQCALHGVPFFLKQLGGFPDKRGHDNALLDGKRYTEMPGMACVTRHPRGRPAMRKTLRGESMSEPEITLAEALEDVRNYLEDQPVKAEPWTVGDVSTPYIGSLRLLLRELDRHMRDHA